jgi:hypothetical protein
MKRYFGRVAIYCSILGAVAAVSVVVIASSASGQAPPVVKLSILDRPASGNDALPAYVTSIPFAEQFASAEAARLAGTSGMRSIYVVPGKAGTICLLVIEPADEAVMADCAARDLLVNGSIYLSMPHSDGTFDVVGVLADGHTAVQAADGRRATVANNVFALDGLTDQHIKLATGSKLTDFDLGPQFPTGQAKTS